MCYSDIMAVRPCSRVRFVPVRGSGSSLFAGRVSARRAGRAEGPLIPYGLAARPQRIDVCTRI